jgi:hypothetical protein
LTFEESVESEERGIGVVLRRKVSRNKWQELVRGLKVISSIIKSVSEKRLL